MHILLVHQAFASLNEPGGTRHHEMARYLAARGHRITIIASPVSYLTGSRDPTSAHIEREPGITILRSYTFPAWHRSFIHRVISFISFMISACVHGFKVKDVDVVWGTSPPIFQGGTAWFLARMKRARFLFEVRDLWPAFAIEVGVLRQPLLIFLSEWFEHFLYRHADQVVVNSPGFIEHVKQRGAKRVALVPNGADPRLFDLQVEGKSFLQKHAIEGEFIVLYAGAHGMSNDLGVALNAAARLRDHPEIVFVFLGDGKEKPTLVSQAKAMGLPNVYFVPPVPKAAMPQALAAADACLAILKPIPLYKTVYPNKVFDYMAAGKAVLLAIDGVIRQVVETAHAGVFVPPGNSDALAEAILTLASQSELTKQMGKNGHAYIASHFDRAALTDEMEKILTAL